MCTILRCERPPNVWSAFFDTDTGAKRNDASPMRAGSLYGGILCLFIQLILLLGAGYGSTVAAVTAICVTAVLALLVRMASGTNMMLTRMAEYAMAEQAALYATSLSTSKSQAALLQDTTPATLGGPSDDDAAASESDRPLLGSVVWKTQ